MTNLNYKEVTAKELGKSMPELSTLYPISHFEHNKKFYRFSPIDVWTKDGWLITAIFDNETTIAVRKGNKVGHRNIDPSEIVYAVRLPKEI